jgi:hypothetical protein
VDHLELGVGGGGLGDGVEIVPVGEGDEVVDQPRPGLVEG